MTAMLRNMLLLSLLVLTLFWQFSARAEGFLLEDIQGNTHRLEDYRGKWVLVNFWATWCPPCLSEIPQLNSLHNAHKDKDLFLFSINRAFCRSGFIPT